ncbi:MAG TPA: NADH-quinone oxidoreductase subunit M, partial [Anaerolineae bacterium]|nr:NADH-quinone oxidoreductase subunit M [Anaerolineae bacterium]
MKFPILSLITFVPLLGALIVLFIPKDKEDWIRWVSTIISLVPLILSFVVYAAVRADAGQMWFMEEYSWIPTLDVYYRMGVDGISAVMVLLTSLLSTLSYFYSIYTIKERVKEY